MVQIVDKTGKIVNNYKYDEWGNITASTETISNPFKYAGEVYDEETGLYYLRARYYDPALGRFINEDPYEGQVTNPLSLNLYTYCYNNPLIYIDPTGQTVQDFFKGMVTALKENLTAGILKWAIEKIIDVDDTSYRYDSGIDYYAGRVVGDALSMGGGIGSIIKEIKTVIANTIGGGGLAAFSGGTLSIAGGAIVVDGVIAGTAEITYGGAVVSTAYGNFRDDLDELVRARGRL